MSVSGMRRTAEIRRLFASPDFRTVCHDILDFSARVVDTVATLPLPTCISVYRKHEPFHGRAVWDGRRSNRTPSRPRHTPIRHAGNDKARKQPPLG
jgi:hypothetical protein